MMIRMSAPLGVGNEMYSLIKRLYPLNRSITGDGVRQTLSIIKERIPLQTYEVPSGTKVFDWTVPNEWNIRDAYIKNQEGVRVVDLNDHTLHVVSYSTPVHATMQLSELKKKLFTLPDHPDWIPYRTSYYSEAWGFCLTHNQMLSLPEGEYEVCIDSTLEPGSLTYGEYFLKGEYEDEILFFTHICHPSLCNDNLSGIALVTELARYLQTVPLRYSYRFVFAPATIGSITWLSCNENHLDRIKQGLVVAVVGDKANMAYKLSRRGNAEIDRAALHILENKDQGYDVLKFSPYGYDERQFCSPGIDLPVGRLTRSPNGCFPEYHTSADNLDLISLPHLEDSLETYLAIIRVLEGNYKYKNLYPKCEPQLGKRGLYRKTGGYQDIGSNELALLWVLNMSDGAHDLLDIAEISGLEFDVIQAAAMKLLECGLLEEDSMS